MTGDNPVHREPADAATLARFGTRLERLANSLDAKWSPQGREETRELGERLARQGNISLARPAARGATAWR
jgi:hypothetical protein